jgi:hypothetical protein
MKTKILVFLYLLAAVSGVLAVDIAQELDKGGLPTAGFIIFLALAVAFAIIGHNE